MTKRPYQVHIEGLVLPPGTVGTRAIQAAIEREVARTMKTRGPGKDASIGTLDVSVGKGTSAETIGAKVAGAAAAKLGKR